MVRQNDAYRYRCDRGVYAHDQASEGSIREGSHAHLDYLAIIAIGLFASGGESRGQTPTVSVETEYLATAEAPLEPPQSAGSRVIVNVPAGGTVRGPKINGTLIAPAGDWLTVMPDGSLRLDVRATIKTDDGEIILVAYSGAFAASKEANDRLNNGEVLTSKDAYFITAPQFTTGSKKYDWLNQIQGGRQDGFAPKRGQDKI